AVPRTSPSLPPWAAQSALPAEATARDATCRLACSRARDERPAGRVVLDADLRLAQARTGGAIGGLGARGVARERVGEVRAVLGRAGREEPLARPDDDGRPRRLADRGHDAGRVAV